MKNILACLLISMPLLICSCSSDNDEEIKKQVVSAIGISDKTVTVKTGETYQFKASYTPSSADKPIFKWSVSDPSIASIDPNGLMKALKDGNTDVVLSADVETGTLKSIAKVTVSPIEIESISLNEDSIGLSWGESKTLEFTVKPSNAKPKAVVWSSGNDAIAKVNNGVVTAIKTGETVITASVSGTDIKAECKVVVLRQSVTSIEFDISEASLEIGQTLQTKILVLPLTAENKNITFSSTNESVATVSNVGLISAIKKGSARIYAKSEDGGFQDYIRVEVVDFTNNIYAFHLGNSSSVNGVIMAEWVVKFRNNSLKTIKLTGCKIVDGYGKTVKEDVLSSTLSPKTNYEMNVSLNRVYNPIFYFTYTESGMNYELRYDPQVK